MIERGTRKCKFFKVSNRAQTTLTPIIIKHVSTNAGMLVSDDWGAYDNLKNIGFRHEVVNHSRNFINPNNPNVHTQTIEGLWRIMKRHSRTTGRRNMTLLMRYGEFHFRYPNDNDKRLIINSCLKDLLK